jgi:hypothetical protein
MGSFAMFGGGVQPYRSTTLGGVPSYGGGSMQQLPSSVQQTPSSVGGLATGGGSSANALMQAYQAATGGGGNGGNGGGGGGSSSSGPITNTAAANPDLQRLQQMYQDRYAQLQKGNKPNDELTTRMMNLASGKINDSAAGAQQQLSENLARRGVAGGGVEQDLRGRVGESAQRAAAGARANIAVGRAGQEEQASLARDQNLSNFVLGGSQIAGAQSQLQLANQELALRQYQIQQQAELARRSEAANAFSNLVGLFR